MDYKISIIIPVYNIEKYIDKCIKSVIEQTYKNIEIILIDDGSTDLSRSICDKYQKEDKRIKVIHQDNNGASCARNTGIKNATGEYIMLIDGDDYIESDMCEKMLKYSIDNNTKITICNFYNEHKDKTVINNSEFANNTIISNITAIKHMFVDDDIIFHVPWNKIYHRSIFFENKDIRYPKGRIHGDSYINYKIYNSVDKILVINKALYHYTHRDNNITYQFDFKKINDSINLTKEIIEWSNAQNEELKQMAYVYAINYLFFCTQLCLKNKKINKCLPFVLKNRKKILLSIKKLKKNKYITDYVIDIYNSMISGRYIL